MRERHINTNVVSKKIESEYFLQRSRGALPIFVYQSMFKKMKFLQPVGTNFLMNVFIFNVTQHIFLLTFVSVPYA